MGDVGAFREEDTDLGVELGAQTTANDSGSMRWNPEWVWRSTDDIKPMGSGHCV
jgi:hypothetical protein